MSEKKEYFGVIFPFDDEGLRAANVVAKHFDGSVSVSDYDGKKCHLAKCKNDPKTWEDLEI